MKGCMDRRHPGNRRKHLVGAGCHPAAATPRQQCCAGEDKHCPLQQYALHHICAWACGRWQEVRSRHHHCSNRLLRRQHIGGTCGRQQCRPACLLLGLSRRLDQHARMPSRPLVRWASPKLTAVIVWRPTAGRPVRQPEPQSGSKSPGGWVSPSRPGASCCIFAFQQGAACLPLSHRLATTAVLAWRRLGPH